MTDVHFEEFAFPINDLTSSVTLDGGGIKRNFRVTFPVQGLAPEVPINKFVYRGRIGGNYVYNVGSPPTGATDIIIVGELE